MKKPHYGQSGNTKNGTTIHESSIKPGTGSGNLYNHVPQNAVDKENTPKRTGYGI